MRIYNKPKTSINWSKPITFEFNNKTYSGFEGDTLASALLSEGNRAFIRSFKFGRKRGIMAAGVEEPNALVSVEQEGQYSPNLKATEVELYEGLKATSATKVDGLDIRALMKPLHRFMPAGFYYKTFIKQKFWSLVENYLRSLAGFSAAPSEADSETYQHNHLFAEVLIIGAGSAGLAAALSALENHSQARIILVDERPELGGELLTERGADERADEWLKQALGDLQRLSEERNQFNAPRLRILTRTTVYGWHDHNHLTALQRLTDHVPPKQRQGPRQIIHKIRAEQVILATGAHERPMLFENNDLINVMLSQSLRRFINQYAALAAGQVVLYGNNDSLVSTALDLSNHAQVTLIDIRQDALSDALKQQLNQAGVILKQGYAIVKALGKHRIQKVELRQARLRHGEWYFGTGGETLKCDLLATSAGFSPVIHLACHATTKPYYNDRYQAFMVADNQPLYQLAGSVAGFFNWQDSLISGRNAALKALQKQALIDYQQELKDPARDYSNVGDFVIPLDLLERPKVFLDLQNDVKTSDIALAIREGYKNIELIKRYTALGFGTDQGKTSNVNGVAVAAKILGLSLAQVGTTTFRPAYTPVPFGALAGTQRQQLFDPQRFTPMHQSHVALAAEFELVGQWYRPWYYPQAGESMHQAVQRECQAARQSLAMMDASTLGKIDIRGKDAREFLARVYTNAWLKLAPGRCRYGLMCDEKGMIVDDGVSACIDNNHFIMTTTTGGAASVYSSLEMWLQTEWKDLDVHLTSVTDHYATIAVVGPEARKLMRKVCQDIDFDRHQFKFMDWREGTVCGVAARVMRISFSGELAYEINIQAQYGDYLWNQLREQGSSWNITPYGTETLHLLRAEKGYIIAGQDTDGSVTPMDANMSWILANNKGFSYIGQRSFSLASISAKQRKQLVGIHTEDSQLVLPEGAHLIDASGQSIGHVSSSYYSAACGRSIALALVRDGLAKINQPITAHLVQPKQGNRKIPCRIVNSVHYDIEGSKVDGND